MRSSSATLLAVVFVLAGSSLSAAPIVFSWSGLPIVGEDPSILPSGTATFEITGSTLTLVLTNTTPQTLNAIGQVLTELTWDITDSGVSLAPLSAVLGPGSRLVGLNATMDTDLSTEWAFKDNIMAGSSPAGPIGSFGVSAVGDINLGTDTYSALDRFDTAGNLFPPPSGSLNGVEAGIVGPSVDLTADGFTSQGPVVQGWDGVNTTLPGQMVFTFNITAGTLTTDEILNVQPLFGTDGAPLIPEPSTIALFALGLGGLGLVRRRKK